MMSLTERERVHQNLCKPVVQRTIPEAAGAMALPLACHSAPCRREAGRCSQRAEVRRSEEQSRNVSSGPRVRRGGGAGLRKGGEANGGVRQRGRERWGRHKVELQLANRVAANLPGVAPGRVGGHEQATPFLMSLD